MEWLNLLIGKVGLIKCSNVFKFVKEWFNVDVNCCFCDDDNCDDCVNGYVNVYVFV